MNKKTKIQKKVIVDSIISYIMDHGVKLTDDFYYWGTYPVVIKDICTSYVVVDHGELKFGDFPSLHKDGEYVGDDIAVDKFICRKTMDQLTALKADRVYLENSFTSMKIADQKQYKKQW